MKYCVLWLFVFCSVFAEDVNFIVAADSHYGNNQCKTNEQINKTAISDMNSLQGESLPFGFEGEIENIRAAVLLGDLTASGNFWNWFGIPLFYFWSKDGFVDDYGLNGDQKLKYPVYEGWGNHDLNEENFDLVVDMIRYRNNSRMGDVTISSNGYHYSWRWGKALFVHLNLYPGLTDKSKESLLFLKEQLLTLADRKTPVVIFQHYGFDIISQDWWTEQERQIFYQVIENYNIVAIFNGHNHVSEHLTWNDIDIYAAGAVMDNDYYFCHMTDSELIVFRRLNGQWNSYRKKTF